ncbi:MAG: hypothetical protein KGL39_07200 [Patescibacteria group bacterium]|nr:hypothetical protein [Patescibacteria group bacterium]
MKECADCGLIYNDEVFFGCPTCEDMTGTWSYDDEEESEDFDEDFDTEFDVEVEEDEEEVDFGEFIEELGPYTIYRNKQLKIWYVSIRDGRPMQVSPATIRNLRAQHEQGLF